MSEGPRLDRSLDGETFRSYYYLKEELTAFCRENGLPVSGGKLEITERIACFLDTGNVIPVSAKTKNRPEVGVISEDMKIEPDFVCSEKHRAFFREVIGTGFPLTWPFKNG